MNVSYFTTILNYAKNRKRKYPITPDAVRRIDSRVLHVIHKFSGKDYKKKLIRVLYSDDYLYFTSCVYKKYRDKNYQYLESKISGKKVQPFLSTVKFQKLGIEDKNQAVFLAALAEFVVISLLETARQEIKHFNLAIITAKIIDLIILRDKPFSKFLK